MTPGDLAATKLVGCSFCGAPKGAPCPALDGRRNVTGVAAHPHVVRRRAYRIRLAARRRAAAAADYRQWLEQLAQGGAGLGAPLKGPAKSSGESVAAERRRA